MKRPITVLVQFAPLLAIVTTGCSLPVTRDAVQPFNLFLTAGMVRTANAA